MRDASQLFDPDDLSDQEQSRLQKLAALRARGIDPYPARVKRSHSIAAARDLYDDGAAQQPTVSVAGRLKRIRVMGKVSFADLDDGTAQIQLLVQRDNLPDGWYNEVWKRLIDLGDFVSATGALSVTRSGELSVTVDEIDFLAKALKPMPDKWHGVRDPEIRYRRRYVDLLANDEARALFRARAVVVRALRTYLDDAGFLEVETPILQPLYGGAAAQPFVTHHNQLHQDLYLRISFELYLKRLIVGGFPAVYEIGRDFRNEGVSFKHNPEFTQLEFYEAYADYEDVMRRTEEMVAFTAEQVTGSPIVAWQGHTIDFSPPWPRIPLRQAILDASGIDYEQFTDADSLRAQMRSRGIEAAAEANWGKLVDQLLTKFCEHKLIQPTFLVDYPRDLSPLAKGMPDDARMVERFEGFAAGMELCNAFTELNDPIDQLQRFLDESYRASLGDEEAHPVDVDYVEALSYGMPPTGGFGMGIDRLTMLLTDRDTIREVILFPHLREIDDSLRDDAAADAQEPATEVALHAGDANA